jgi:hypothetical protein
MDADGALDENSEAARDIERPIALVNTKSWNCLPSDIVRRRERNKQP